MVKDIFIRSIEWVSNIQTDKTTKIEEYQTYLGAIFILRKGRGVGGWSRKGHFSLTLCNENVLT